MEPFAHPDLAALGRRLRARMDQTLDAEQSAARTAARRRRSMRDALLLIEDRSEAVVLHTTDGRSHQGRLLAVGVDHVEIDGRPAGHLIALHHIVSIAGGAGPRLRSAS